jgi:hypothetical protein
MRFLHYGFYSLDVEIDRFFTVSRLLRLDRAAQQVGMGVGRRSDQHCVDLIRRPDLCGAGRHLRTVFDSQLLGRSPVDIIDSVQGRSGVGGDIVSMNRADKTGPKESKFGHHLHLFSKWTAALLMVLTKKRLASRCGRQGNS